MQSLFAMSFLFIMQGVHVNINKVLKSIERSLKLKNFQTENILKLQC